MIAILFAAVPGAIDLIRTQRAVKEVKYYPKLPGPKRGIREQVFPIYENDASIDQR